MAWMAKCFEIDEMVVAPETVASPHAGVDVVDLKASAKHRSGFVVPVAAFNAARRAFVAVALACCVSSHIPVVLLDVLTLTPRTAPPTLATFQDCAAAVAHPWGG